MMRIASVLTYMSRGGVEFAINGYRSAVPSAGVTTIVISMKHPQQPVARKIYKHYNFICTVLLASGRARLRGFETGVLSADTSTHSPRSVMVRTISFGLGRRCDSFGGGG